MKFERILKWLPAFAGAIVFLAGLVIKLKESPADYDQFITGGSYIMIVIGIEAVILNFAFNRILQDNDKQNKK